MRFDLRWLEDNLDRSPGADALADALTACGFLVELRDQVDDSEEWDVDVTTNRPDAMNHRGLAREAAAATGVGLKPLSFALAESDEAVADLLTVTVEAPAACTRFCARVVRGVVDGPSPEWLRRRLEHCGVRPTSAVVDVTNYVLLTLGQPLHAYDLRRLTDARLTARMAAPGELLTTLDGERRVLDASMPVIADGRGAVGLAGLMGGAATEISAATTDVVLEAAHFEALVVRRMARALGMHTEASHRFERGADPELPPLAVDLAAAMIADLAGGTVCRGRLDVRPRPYQPHQVALRLPALNAFAGLDLAPDTVLSILTALDFAPQCDGDQLLCTVPSFRVDVECAADLYEEVIRHVGYNEIPAVLPVLSSAPGRRHANWELVDRARRAAVAAGLYEAVTYSFVSLDDDAWAAESPLCLGEPLPLANPLAVTQSTMRRSLLPGLLTAARENLNRGELSLALFEQGRVFAAAAGAPCESERLAVVLAGAGVNPAGDARADFSQLKGVVTAVLDRLALRGLGWRRGGAPWLDEAAGAEVLAQDERVVAVVGRLAGDMAARWELKHELYVAEIDLSAAPVALPLTCFEPLPRVPGVVADMTVEHSRELAYATLQATTRELAGRLVEAVELHSRFSGPGLPVGSVRTTLRLLYRHPERSLTQDEVNAEHEALRAQLAERLDVRFA